MSLFSISYLVFAKMKGFPHWPARKRVPVYFFGTHQIGHLPPENIVPYFGNKMKYGSGVRIKGFAEGMWEIQNTPGVGSKLRVTDSAQTPKRASKDVTSTDVLETAASTRSRRSAAGGRSESIASVEDKKEVREVGW
uniref:PWWP domain-containing protein n=1 Tax=Sparus aurata TaxID=8175 RepID=A0A671UIS4_SPAAU